MRIIGADDLLNMLVMIDSAYAVYDDMRGHTGGLNSFGIGVVDQKAAKQKMNSRSSTETEHIGTSEYLPTLYTWNFSYKGKDITPRLCWQRIMNPKFVC